MLNLDSIRMIVDPITGWILRSEARSYLSHMTDVEVLGSAECEEQSIINTF